MCDHSGKLVAWLDRELGDGEMAEFERHIAACSDCQCRIQTYRQVSVTFDSYCSAMLLAKTRKRRLPRWVPAVTAAAVASAAALVFALLPARVAPPAISPSTQAQAPSPVTVVEKVAAPAPGKVAHRQRPVAQTPRQGASWQPTERAIQIAIPAESMFPPGAVPDGVNFTAELSIAPDGSAEQIQLRPRLIEVQRRQP